MNVKKRKLSPAATAGIGVGAALLFALAGWFLLISPQRSRSAELDTEIAAVEQQITEARAAAAKADDAQPIQVAELFRLTKAMPADSDMAGVLLELSRIASETGIVFESIVPQATISGGTFRSQPIEVVFVGDFYTLSDFLFRLRSLVSVQRGKLLATGRLFAVDRIQFVEADTSFPHIKAVLRVSAFLYGTGPAGGAAPSPPPVPGSDGMAPTDPNAPTDTTATTPGDTTSTPTPETPPSAPVEGNAAGTP